MKKLLTFFPVIVAGLLFSSCQKEPPINHFEGEWNSYYLYNLDDETQVKLRISFDKIIDSDEVSANCYLYYYVNDNIYQSLTGRYVNDESYSTVLIFSNNGSDQYVSCKIDNDGYLHLLSSLIIPGKDDIPFVRGR